MHSLLAQSEEARAGADTEPATDADNRNDKREWLDWVPPHANGRGVWRQVGHNKRSAEGKAVGRNGRSGGQGGGWLTGWH